MPREICCRTPASSSVAAALTAAANLSLAFTSAVNDTEVVIIWLYVLIILGIGGLSCLLGLLSYFICRLVKKKKSLDDYEEEESLYEQELYDYTSKELQRKKLKGGRDFEVEMTEFQGSRSFPSRARAPAFSRPGPNSDRRRVGKSERFPEEEADPEIKMMPGPIGNDFFQSRVQKSSRPPAERRSKLAAQEDDDLDLKPSRQKPVERDPAIGDPGISRISNLKETRVVLESELEISQKPRTRVVKKLVKKKKLKKSDPEDA